MNIKSLVASVALLASAAQLQAVTIFSDNFDSENGGVANASTLNYTSFTNWTVSGGTVDIIGNGYFDFIPGNGLYLDMDGSTNNAGKITSVALALLAGDYSLSYYLAGNHRNGSQESVNVGVEVGLAAASHSLSQNAGFQQFFLNFSLAAAQNVNITFEGLGGDNIGMLLDNVVLEMRDTAAVPDTGSTLALLGLGLLGAAAIRRRIR